jgi:hypothetical protein
MANDLTGPVWRIDTPSATLIYDKLVHVKGIRWVSKGAVAGDDVEIHDGTDRIVWKSVAGGSNYVEADATVRHIYGVSIPVLDSGELYIEVQ